MVAVVQLDMPPHDDGSFCFPRQVGILVLLAAWCLVSYASILLCFVTGGLDGAALAVFYVHVFAFIAVAAYTQVYVMAGLYAARRRVRGR